MDINKKLINLAIEARKKAYTPYSKFNVGACLLCKNGEIYTGCNIENASLTPTVCAERTAIFKAISEGNKDFKKIVVVGGKNEKLNDFCAPCGVCRQVISEFVNDNFEIILAINENNYKVYNFRRDIFPLGFTKDDLD
ncbi:cytidine deaminase [Gemelliphila asaccharolytica]|uniref:Cytidine deaminase n=1 Tax=Gemelliphila asaccharolytica TaxID=502393 RepID=A0ABR5TKC7_9BACL|nr:cytidine deaminase [Gemella asaccharolytica]KXB55137.1 cytidine deaminase [Gemella asaccharolytica]